MTREDAVAALRRIQSRPYGDIEWDHIGADRVLVDLIGDAEIADLFDKIDKWYA